MFRWITNLMAVPPADRQQQEDPRDLFHLSMKQARGAFALPADYFNRVKGGLPLPDIELEAVAFSDSISQNPLYRVMNAVHPHIPQAVRDRLWKDGEFKNILAHVFHNVSEESVREGADKLDDGYNAVFKRLLARVLAEGLVGRPRHYDAERWVYEIEKI